MSNVIRPTFGTRGTPTEAGPDATAAVSPPVAAPAASERRRDLQLYGQAAGYAVGLLRDEDGPEGPTHRIVVGPLDTNVIEVVAVVPATAEGEIDAERTAMAILRAFEIVEAG